MEFFPSKIPLPSSHSANFSCKTLFSESNIFNSTFNCASVAERQYTATFERCNWKAAYFIWIKVFEVLIVLIATNANTTINSDTVIQWHACVQVVRYHSWLSQCLSVQVRSDTGTEHYDNLQIHNMFVSSQYIYGASWKLEWWKVRNIILLRGPTTVRWVQTDIVQTKSTHCNAL